MEFGLPVFMNRETNRGPQWFSSNDSLYEPDLSRRTTGTVRSHGTGPCPTGPVIWTLVDATVGSHIGWSKNATKLIGYCSLGSEFPGWTRGIIPMEQVRGPTRPVICALLNGTVGSHIGWSKLATELYVIQFPWSRLARLDKGYHPHRTGPWSNPARYLCSAE